MTKRARAWPYPNFGRYYHQSYWWRWVCLMRGIFGAIISVLTVLFGQHRCLLVGKNVLTTWGTNWLNNKQMQQKHIFSTMAQSVQPRHKNRSNVFQPQPEWVILKFGSLQFENCMGSSLGRAPNCTADAGRGQKQPASFSALRVLQALNISDPTRTHK